MKLHLPKGLRTAIIAAISIFSGFTATLGSAAYADSFLPSLANDQGALALTWCTGNMTGGWDGSLTTAKVKTGIDNFKLSNTGWYGFLGNGANAFSTDPKLLKDGNNNVSGFSFCGRQNYNGEAIVSMVSVQDILSGTTDNTLTSFSISFEGSAASNGIYFSAWAWDGTEATQLVGNSKINGGAFTTKTFSVNDLNLKESDKILLSWWNNDGNGALNTINNLTTTFTSKYDAANEGPHDLTWDFGASCNWADKVWTYKGGKVDFRDGDNIYFPTTDVGNRVITVDGKVAVGNITMQAGNDDATVISGKAGSTISVESVSIGAGGILAFAGFDEITFKAVSLEKDSELDFRGLSGTVTVTDKMTDVAENTIILANSTQAGGKSEELYLSANYSTPDELNKAINSIASLQSLVDKWYIDDGDVDNLDKLGTIVFTVKQSNVQPEGTVSTLDIDKRKVVFDKGIVFIGHSNTNGTQSVNIKNRGEMTVNGAILENKRLTVNVTTGGKLTATEGIYLGHEAGGNYPAWMNLKSAEITTKYIKGQNLDARTAFTMSSELYQLPGNPRPTEQGGTLTITGDSAFGLTASGKRLTVTLNAGTLTSTAASMNLVDAAYAESENIFISVGGTFNIAAKDGCTITINHALGGSGTGTGTSSGTLVFNGAGTVALASGVNLGGVSFNQTNGTVTLAGPITLGDGATFTQTAGKKIELTALKGDAAIKYSNYAGGTEGNGLQQAGTVDVITGGTLNGNVVVTYNGKDYTLTNDNRGIGGSGDNTTYYVNTATADMSKIAAFSADITTVVLSGGNLIMDTAKPDTISLTASANSTLTINEGVSMNQTALTVEDGKTVTLAGAGQYVTNVQTMNVTLGDAWTGTVTVSGLNEITNFDISAYGNANSTVELNGVKGYLVLARGQNDNAGLTYAQNIKFTDNGDTKALEITNGWPDLNGTPGDPFTFTGKISGDGTLFHNSSPNKTITFSGDVSEWTGAIVNAQGGDGWTTTYNFAGSADTINAAFDVNDGTVGTIAYSITNDGAVAIGGAITDKHTDSTKRNLELSVNAEGGASFNKAVTVKSVDVAGGSAIFKSTLDANTLTVASGATLDISGATSATVGTLDLAGGSTLVLGSDAMALSNLTLTNVSSSALLNVQGLGEEVTVLFTGLATEGDISNITFTDKMGKRVANAADYISDAAGWLVYDATATTLSFATSITPDFFWADDSDSGTWNDSTLWAKEATGTPDSTFIAESNVTFAGQGIPTVTLESPATASKVTIKNADYTFKGEQLTVLNGLSVKDAAVTFHDGVDLKAAAVNVGSNSSLTIGKDTTMKSLSNEGTVDLGDCTLTLTNSTEKGGTVKAGAVNLTGDNTFTELTVTGGTLSLTSGTLTVTGALNGVNKLEVATLPSNGPVITAGSISGDSLVFDTTADVLNGLDFSLGKQLTLISGAAPSVSLALDSVEKGSSVTLGEKKFIVGTDDANNVILTMARGGNEWTGSGEAITWDGTADGWTSAAPGAGVDANFLGDGPTTVLVDGAQSASKLVVDTQYGTSDDYTLKAADGTEATVTLGTGMELVSGCLTISDNVTVSTPSVSIEDGASLTITRNGALELTSGNLPASVLANNEGTVTMDSLNGGTYTAIGGTIKLRQDSTYTGDYNPGTKVVALGGTQKLKADGNLTVAGSTGSIDFTDGTELGGIDTTGANVSLTANTAGLNLDNASTMEGGELNITFSAVHAIANAGDKAGVEKAFTGEAIHLNGVTINISQSETDNNVAIVPNDSMGTTGIVLFTISDVSGSTFDETTKIGEIDAPMLDKYFTNFRLGKGSVYVLVDLNLTHYSSTLKAQTENGAAGIHMADNALARIAPQEGANRAQYKDLANVLDAMDNFGPQDAVAADRFAAAFAGASTAILGSAVAGDMDRQLLSIRNRTTSMGCVSGAIMEDDTMPSFWFNAEGDYRRIKSAGTTAGYNMSSWGATVGADYNVNTNTTLGLAVTSMFGKLSVSSADHTTGDMNAYYVTGIARYARGAWVNTFIASVGITDLTLDRTVAVPGASSYTTHGSTSGVSFGMMYELAYTIPMNSEASTCLQPVFNVAIKHTTVDSYHETGSDAALHVGSQSLTSVSFGLGGRLQTTIGETLYNRASVLEMRAMAKVEAGDRYSSADVSLAAKDSIRGSVKSAEKETLGLELGAGLFIPLGVDNGTLFFDVSAEIRQDAPSVNGTVGYRLTF